MQLGGSCAHPLSLCLYVSSSPLPYTYHSSFLDLICVTNWLRQFSAWEVFLRDEWSTATFMTTYLPIMLFPVLYVSAKVITGVPLVSTSEMDFESGVSEFDAITSVFIFLKQAPSF